MVLKSLLSSLEAGTATTAARGITRVEMGRMLVEMMLRDPIAALIYSTKNFFFLEQERKY